MTGTVGRHVAGTGFEAFDPRTVDRAKIRIIDSLGNIAAGHRAQGNGAVLDLARRWGGAAGIKGAGPRRPPAGPQRGHGQRGDDAVLRLRADRRRI